MQSLQNATNSAATAADCAREVLDVVPAVLRPIRQHMRRHRAAGLSIPQFRSLCFVERYDGASLSMVADHLDLSLPTVSRMISGLVQRGYMQRKNSADDRRHVALSLRARGQVIMRDARQATQQFLADKFQDLSPEQREALVAAMGALREVFEQEMPHPAADAEGELAEAR